MSSGIPTGNETDWEHRAAVSSWGWRGLECAVRKPGAAGREGRRLHQSSWRIRISRAWGWRNRSVEAARHKEMDAPDSIEWCTEYRSGTARGAGIQHDCTPDQCEDSPRCHNPWPLAARSPNKWPVELPGLVPCARKDNFPQHSTVSNPSSGVVLARAGQTSASRNERLLEDGRGKKEGCPKPPLTLT